MPTAGSTIQLFSTAFDQNGLIVSTSFTWSSDNARVATLNSGTGLATGVANGICNIQAQANDSGAAKGTISVGVALLSANTISLAYGNSTTISSVGGFNTANWCGGAEGAAHVVAGTIVNGFGDTSDGACSCPSFSRRNLLSGSSDRHECSRVGGCLSQRAVRDCECKGLVLANQPWCDAPQYND